MPGAPTVSVGAISERDIDLLFVEEFTSSPDFVRWFLAQIDVAVGEPLEMLLCRRSATDSTGESDVEVFVRAGPEVVAILLEDKVHAAVQPRQAERYRERGEGHVRAERCQRFITVLVAPRIYLQGRMRGFDKTVSYEDLVGQFEGGSIASARSRFKAAVLRGAIEKATKGYQAQEDASVTQFWQRYWDRSQVLAPDLDMRKPIGRPASSSFVYFRPAGLPKGSFLVHKMAHGLIDVQFDGMANKLAELRARYGNSLKADMRITRAGKSGVIRIDVPRLRPTLEAEGQLHSIDTCLLQAVQLLAWFRGV